MRLFNDGFLPAFLCFNSKKGKKAVARVDSKDVSYFSNNYDSADVSYFNNNYDSADVS